MIRAGLSIAVFSLAVACTTPLRQAPSCNLQQTSGTRDNLRDARYCEILLFQGRGNNISGCVYNTLGLNDCPQDQWEELDASELKRQYGASAVVLNGPRHFIMDRTTLSTAGSDVIDFGGVQMRPFANVELPPGGLAGGGQTPYTETTIDRVTEYVYLAGRPIYQLTSPDGIVYIMQSYSQIIDPTLTAADLPNLGSRLKLPEGWQYSTRTPDSDLSLVSTGKATVLQDDLQNSYQRADT